MYLYMKLISIQIYFLFLPCMETSFPVNKSNVFCYINNFICYLKMSNTHLKRTNSCSFIAKYPKFICKSISIILSSGKEVEKLYTFPSACGRASFPPSRLIFELKVRTYYYYDERMYVCIIINAYKNNYTFVFSM